MRSFWLMFVVEFQNAFSDNVLRWLVTFLIVGMGLSLEKRDSLVPLVGAVFALPFVLFSMAGGFFADRYSKRNVAIAVKCAELGIMSVASVGLWLDNIPLMLAGIFLMSTHSAIFGPTKYGMLPELLPEKKLSWGNGLFGLGTFSAAITGTIFAGMFRTFLTNGSFFPASSLSCWRSSDCPCASASGGCPPPTPIKNSGRIFWAISFPNSGRSAGIGFYFSVLSATHFSPFWRCCCS